jgi:phosphopantetheine adenylyltransferase
MVTAAEEAFAAAPVVDFHRRQPGKPIIRGFRLPWDFELERHSRA